MNALEKLIRFHRYQLDEKRRELRMLEEREAGIQDAIRALDDRVVSEQTKAKASQAGVAAYGGFARASLDRREALVRNLEAATQAAATARDALLDAFAELKRFEISLDRRNEFERQERNRREQEALDEAAINFHNRRDAY